MLTLGMIALLGAVVLAVTSWTGRRWNKVSRRQAAHRDQPIFDAGPPIFDLGDWLNGGHT